jgi:general secretion pathway protein E
MIRAAETGHMVLATLHASTIRGAISRLEYLNIPAHDLRYIIRSIMVQNLVKTLCGGCGGAGCEKCFHTGYAGRTIVSEVQYFENETEFDRMDRGDVFWPRLISDAVDLMERGVTNLKELDRVYGATVHEEIARRRLDRDGG